jgi:hypothetical protein
MHLIQPLASGVNGAANGTVDIYRRGTSSRATYYTSFEGGPSYAPTAALALDGYGGTTVYVNELVTCVVKDSSGNTVRTFVGGAGAPAVEVISDSFTGVDYATGASGLSKPTTLQAVLDKWNDSAGANDFNVILSGATYTLQAAIARLGGFFFNVKSPAYGAVGDGVADDGTPIIAAMAACGAAGGGIVFLPAGTYRIDESLSVPAGVSLLGCSGATTIKMDHPTATGWLNFVGQALSSQQSVRGIRFDAIQANSGHVIQWNNIGGAYYAKLLVEDCVFGNATLMSGRLIYSSGAIGLRVRSCAFFMGTGNSAVYCPSGPLSVLGCTFTWGGQSYTGTCLVVGNGCEVVGNDFDTSPQTAGVTTLIDATVAAYAPVFTGNTVSQGNSLPIIFYAGFSGTIVVPLVESGNSLGAYGTMTIPVPPSAAVLHSGPQLTSRIAGRYYLADPASATLTCDTVRYAYFEYERNTTNIATVNFGQPVAVNMTLVLAWYNNQVSTSGVITLDAFTKGLATFTVNANSVSYYYFVSTERGAATRKWVLIGSLVNQTP